MAQILLKIKECFFPETAISCKWYSDCLDLVYNCGPKGFPKGQATLTCNGFFYTS